MTEKNPIYSLFLTDKENEMAKVGITFPNNWPRLFFVYTITGPP